MKKESTGARAKLRQYFLANIGRVSDKSMGGTDDLGNLRAICSVCNEGAKNLTTDRPSARKLLIQMRRATGADQLAVLDWLLKKYPQRGAK